MNMNRTMTMRNTIKAPLGNAREFAFHVWSAVAENSRARESYLVIDASSPVHPRDAHMSRDLVP